jgi:hypothetical protein
LRQKNQLLQAYVIKRKTIFGNEIIYSTNGKNDNLVYVDKFAFNFEDIEYVIEEDHNIIGSVTVRPKNYLINHLTNQMLISKKKWWV